MPMYTTLCDQCGRRETIFRHVSQRDADLPSCHGQMRRAVEAPAVQTDLPGYVSPVSGKWIEGKKARTEDLKASGCRPWEGMETERKEAVKRAEEADRQFESTMEAGLHDTFKNMPAEKQRVLESAIQ